MQFADIIRRRWVKDKSVNVVMENLTKQQTPDNVFRDRPWHG